jgi:curved DNA-binding protein CbpA
VERGDHSFGADPYQRLGVRAGASRQDIVRAYHRAAHTAHPDARPADPDAAARFQALTDAYDMLSDASRRADYDRNLARPHKPERRTSAPPGGRPDQPPGAWIWAGPVHVDPPSHHAAPAGGPRYQPSTAPQATELLDWYLDQVWDWLW